MQPPNPEQQWAGEGTPVSNYVGPTSRSTTVADVQSAMADVAEVKAEPLASIAAPLIPATYTSSQTRFDVPFELLFGIGGSCSAFALLVTLVFFWNKLTAHTVSGWRDGVGFALLLAFVGIITSSASFLYNSATSASNSDDLLPRLKWWTIIVDIVIIIFATLVLTLHWFD